MSEERIASRWIALLMLAQVAGGPIANFILLGPVFRNPPGYLVNAAPHGFELALAVLLGLGLAAASAGIAIAGWPVFRRHSERMALWLVVIGGGCLALTGVEYIGLLSMRSLSEAFTAAGSPDGELYLALRGVVGSARNWAHYVQLLFAGSLFFLLCTTLYRFRLVPRALAGFGMAAALVMLSSIARPLFGGTVIFTMLAPLGVANLALAGWLLVKGLRQDVAATR